MQQVLFGVPHFNYHCVKVYKPFYWVRGAISYVAGTSHTDPGELVTT